jgi:biotin carboxyl carrier protein
MKYVTTINDETFAIEINHEDEIVVNGEPYAIDFVNIGEGNLHSLLINNESYEALVEERDGQWQVLLRGNLYTAIVADERTERMSARSTSLVPDSGEVSIKAPMPGLVVAIPVEEGQQVEVNDPVIILESMKMENELRAPREGVVERIAVTPGDSVEMQQVLVVIV